MEWNAGPIIYVRTNANSNTCSNIAYKGIRCACQVRHIHPISFEKIDVNITSTNGPKLSRAII